MSQPDAVASSGDGALFTVDLSEHAGPETGGQKLWRIVLGLVLMILGGVLALACGAAFIAAWFVDEFGFWAWADLLGDGLLFIGALFLGVAILGFEIMRRGRKARNATSYLEALSKVPGMEEANDTYAAGTAAPGTVSADEHGPVLPPGTPPAGSPAKPIV